MVLRAANQNPNDCQWQSYLNVAHTGVAPSGDSLRSQSVFPPPWLPRWGSCHEVTERVISPHPSRLRRATFTSWSNCHWQLLDFDLLRGAPPQGKAGVTDCHTSVATLVRNDMLYTLAHRRTDTEPVPSGLSTTDQLAHALSAATRRTLLSMKNQVE